MGTALTRISASFGPALTGQGSNVGYRVLDASNGILIARTTSGVSERRDAAGNQTTGAYIATAAFDTAWIAGRILWDITGQAGVLTEDIFVGSPSGLYTRPLAAILGPAYTGKVGSVGYSVQDGSGNVLIARRTAGVTERADAAGNAVTGVYEVNVANWDPTWSGVILWDITGVASAVGEEIFPDGGGTIIGSAARISLNIVGRRKYEGAIG